MVTATRAVVLEMRVNEVVVVMGCRKLAIAMEAVVPEAGSRITAGGFVYAVPTNVIVTTFEDAAGAAPVVMTNNPEVDDPTIDPDAPAPPPVPNVRVGVGESPFTTDVVRLVNIPVLGRVVPIADGVSHVNPSKLPAL